MEILIVTGLSGAGKSTSLRALEDLGYYCVDNLPVPMLPALVETKLGGPKRLAVGIDARAEDHLHPFPEVRQTLIDAGHDIDVLFLEAPDALLVRRFSETRRRHPMGELPAAIGRERERLRDLRALASATIDTETFSSRQLRQLIRDRYGTQGGALHLVLMSFGFKNGMPSEADLIFDARFLKNPFGVAALRPLGGFDEPVRAYVLDQPDAQTLLRKIEDWLRFQAPRTAAEGRSYLTVGLGCTGGQHRSVALIEALHAVLSERPAAEPPPIMTVRHRDLEQALADTAAFK